MLNINNNAAQLKREILVRMAKLQLEGKLVSDIRFIPRQLAPEGSTPIRCCIWHDRHILRMRIMARLGCSVEDYDDERTITEYAEDALKREKPTWPMLTVLHDACNACVRSHYMVTNACQACLARPCQVNCPKKAITVYDHRAHIDETKCINCGLCMQNCPYHSVIKIPVPCEEACPVGAISKDETGHERIDYDKCIFCGNCMRECPFSAIMDKSQLVDVLRRIMDGKKKVVAMYAPAIAAQFRAAPGQLEAALLKAGFDDVLEVALGADVCADKEAKEFEERMARGDKMMTTSCCPAYVRAVNIHVPALSPCISATRSPMHYTAELAKKKYPDCITVFVGPCLAKRREGYDDNLVDYVLSIEEIGALFVAKEIDVGALEAKPGAVVPTTTGRAFAATGGVAESVKVRLHDVKILRAAVINGLNKAGMKTLANYGQINSGAVPTPADCPNLIEVMACEGGCIAGPSVITNPKVAAFQLKKYVDDGVQSTTEMSLEEKQKADKEKAAAGAIAMPQNTAAAKPAAKK